MDDVIAGKFAHDYNLTQAQITARESSYEREILPAIKRRYLSHLVSTVEDIINEKRKQELLSSIRNEIDKAGSEQYVDYYNRLVKTINLRMLRLFSIILAPVESNKLKARTHLIKGCALITYWKDLPETQKRILIAHELGHIINKYFYNASNDPNEEGLATLFGFIALCDKDKFYKTGTSEFIHHNDIEIYDEMTNLCKRKNM
jgi:hypothetical protein